MDSTAEPTVSTDDGTEAKKSQQQKVIIIGESRAKVFPKYKIPKRRKKKDSCVIDTVDVVVCEHEKEDALVVGDEEKEEEEEDITSLNPWIRRDSCRSRNGLLGRSVEDETTGRSNREDEDRLRLRATESDNLLPTYANATAAAAAALESDKQGLHPSSAITTVSQEVESRQKNNQVNSSKNNKYIQKQNTRNHKLSNNNHVYEETVEKLLAECQVKSLPASPSQLRTAPAKEENVRRSRGRKCVDCCKNFLAFLFSTVGLCCLMIGYVIIGGFIFQCLEAPNEELTNEEMREMRRLYVEELWRITEAMNILHPDNWSALAEQILVNYTVIVYDFAKKRGWDYNEERDERQWSFAGALLYSITVITTIGYGHIAPKTAWGRIVTMLYAIVGIPLTLLTITNLGGFMATAFRFIYRNICCGLCCLCCGNSGGGGGGSGGGGGGRNCNNDRHDKHSTNRRHSRRKKDKNIDSSSHTSVLTSPDDVRTPSRQLDLVPAEQSKSVEAGDRETLRKRLGKVFNTKDLKTVTVPIYISLLLITGYIAFGALLFSLWEKDWTYLIGCYFCFITLSTIGFGDYVPGTSLQDAWNSQGKLVFCAMYLVFGLALMAMCFDLMQEQARSNVKAIARKIGLLGKRVDR